MTYSTTNDSWDPFYRNHMPKPSNICLNRIRQDMKFSDDNPLPGINLVLDEYDVTLIHALLEGPPDTPYEGGFFYFLMRCPPDYPMRPPKVKMMTTGEGRVEFNPHLFRTGTVCLSILGTWYGPTWCPALSLSSIALSIQSLMGEIPNQDEPESHQSSKKLRYKQDVLFKTMKFAVCDMVDGSTCDSRNMPPRLRKIMEEKFLKSYDYYVCRCDKGVQAYEQIVPDPTLPLAYETLLKRIKKIKKKLDAELRTTGSEIN